MKMNRGEVLAVAGAICLLAAAGLTGYNALDAQRAARESAEALSAVSEAIAARDTADTSTSANGGSADTPDSSDSAQVSAAVDDAATSNPDIGVTVDGVRYLGYLSVPTLKLELPVHAEWDDMRVQSAPCRYSGSIAGGALVIGAHNYDKHFGGLSKLAEGDVIVITDGNGAQHRYSVSRSEILRPDEVDAMKSDAWDLTLFTCTYGGQSRVTVRCFTDER